MTRDERRQAFRDMLNAGPYAAHLTDPDATERLRRELEDYRPPVPDLPRVQHPAFTVTRAELEDQPASPLAQLRAELKRRLDAADVARYTTPAATLAGIPVHVSTALPRHAMVIAHPGGAGSGRVIIVGNVDRFRLTLEADQQRKAARAWLRDYVHTVRAELGLWCVDCVGTGQRRGVLGAAWECSTCNGDGIRP